jgi:kynurenine formamidase
VALDRLRGEAVIVDIPSTDWFEVTPELLEDSPEPIRPGDIVVLRTGWSAHTGNESRYILQAPGLTKDGVDWLIDKGIKLIASDSPSPEHIFMRCGGWNKLRPDLFGDVTVDATKFPAHYGHKQFLGNGICLLEGLGGDIAQISERRVELMALPMKYAGVEAAPARVVAWT